MARPARFTATKFILLFDPETDNAVRVIQTKTGLNRSEATRLAVRTMARAMETADTLTPSPIQPSEPIRAMG